ncbi:hypothetical protein IV203_017974 [Nitzschia inconspicua]|uniref:Uncharacterized protein n=1 Tax=Nitzschia inconspicua TaxID=303405 RepID=A0A9K3Q563_9STRA|nr:hypothetical protein IV203_017974 [Nitzschia inconspicua]
MSLSGELPVPTTLSIKANIGSSTFWGSYILGLGILLALHMPICVLLLRYQDVLKEEEDRDLKTQKQQQSHISTFLFRFAISAVLDWTPHLASMGWCIFLASVCFCIGFAKMNGNIT